MVCDRCGGRVTPLKTSGSGFRHIPGLPMCRSKPPRAVLKWVAWAEAQVAAGNYDE